MLCPSCGRPNPAEAEFCARCGGPLTAVFTQERRWVTAVFFDLSRFTEFTLKNPLEDTWKAVDGALQQAAELVRSHGGTVDKFFGDGLLALFGATRSQEGDARWGLEAAHAMVASSPLPGRAGVASGLVLRTPLGGGVAGDQTVLGPAINLAQRLSQAAPAGEVWVDAASIRLASGALAQKLSPMALKGYAEPLSPYRYQGLAQDAEASIGLENVQAFLRQAFSKAEAGSARRVVLLGPMGVGKSCALRQFLASLPSGVRKVMVPKLSQGVALRHALKLALLEMLETDSVNQLDAWVEGLGLEAPLDTVLAYSLGLAAKPGVEPAALDRALVQAWQLALERFSQQAPLVVALEDLHAADPTVLEFARKPLYGRVLLLVTSRRNRFERAEDIDLFEMAPLSREHSRKLLLRLCPELESKRATALAALSGGFPLVLQSLALNPVGEPEPIPFFQPRLDALPRVVRNTLCAVAALGDGSPPELIRLVAGDEADLARLVAEGFLEAEPDGRLAFSVPLLREAALGQVSAQQSVAWHREAALWYQSQNLLFEAARHLEAAGEPHQAFRILRLYAQQAWQTAQHDAAIAGYREALRLAEGPLAQPVMLELCERLLSLGRFAEVLDLVTPETIAQHPSFRAVRAEALLELGKWDEAEALLTVSAHEPRIRLTLSRFYQAPGALTYLEELPPSLQAQGRLRRAEALARTGKLKEAAEAFASYLALPEGSPYRQSQARLQLSRIHWKLFQPAQALEVLPENSEAPSGLGWLRLAELVAKAGLWMDLGQYQKAEPVFENALASLEDASSGQRAQNLTSYMRFLIETGRLYQALEHGTRAAHKNPHPWLLAHLALAKALAGETGDSPAFRLPANEPYASEETGSAYALAGAIRALKLQQDPTRMFKQALVLAISSPNPRLYYLALLGLGFYLWKRSPKKASALSQHLLTHTARSGFVSYHQWARLLCVQVHLEQGKEAQHLLQFSPSTPLAAQWRLALLKRLGDPVETLDETVLVGYGILGEWVLSYWRQA